MTERTWAEIGEIVKDERLRRGLTQSALAHLANERMGGQVLSVANVGNIEAARRDGYSARTLIGLATAFGWPPDAIDRLRNGEPLNAVLQRIRIYTRPPEWDDTGAAREHLRAEMDHHADPNNLNLASADGVDLERLAELDPEGYAAVITQARLLLKRAEERAG